MRLIRNECDLTGLLIISLGVTKGKEGMKEGEGITPSNKILICSIIKEEIIQQIASHGQAVRGGGLEVVEQ